MDQEKWGARNDVEMDDSDEELSRISIEASKAPISTQLLGAQPTIGSKVSEWFIDRLKYIPLQLLQINYQAKSHQNMSKRAGPCHNGDEPTSKRLQIDEGNHTLPLALYNPYAWEILRKFLTSDMSMAEMDTALESHLGSRFSAEIGWNPDIKYVPESESPQASPIRQSRKPRKKNLYIIDEAEEDDKDEEEEYGDGDGDRQPVWSPKVTRLLGASAKDRLAATFNDMVTQFERNPTSLSHGCQNLAESRMYLLHVQRSATEYVTVHLRKQKFPVIVSAWIAGQLYVVSDSPKTIAESLPSSLHLAVKEYICVTDAEREAVQCSRSKLHDPAWVRITNGKYKDNVGRVFKSEDGFVQVLIATCDFPYNMPRGSRGLLERSRLWNSKAVSDIVQDGEVVGCTCDGERYYQGLLLKTFRRDLLELVASPHVNDIQHHLEAGWDMTFLKTTVLAFLIQFLCVGDWARVVKGHLRGEVGQVASTDHMYGSVGLEFTFDTSLEEIEVQLEDIERVFRVGDTVKVVAGPYLGLEGHVIQMNEDVFHICQDISKEVVEVLKYYLDRHPLKHTLNLQLPMQQIFEPPHDSDSIEIGDHIEVLCGEHARKHGVVDWFAKGETSLWFRDIFTADREPSISLLSISIPVKMFQRTNLAQTIQFTKERGYDIRPGDAVSVVRGPEFGMKGLMQHVDFPNAALILICDSDKSLINVPIKFFVKLHNASLDPFKKDIGQEVFVIGGDRKGYRGTLQSFHQNLHHCFVTRYGMRLNGAILEGPEFVSFCEMQKRSYLALPPQSITPPVEQVPSSSSASITDPDPLPSNGLSALSTSLRSADVEHGLSSSVIPSSSSSLQAWSVDELDIRDSLDARTDKP
ncbi:uncharacterized protein F5147DRAFT_782149 [Suillus discolor]|uniref:KOW domain-containing protein n=1 Tax=Suillus discolor TaxID=1912936 RepID=A0A9P7ESB3_9AGAM|nr:uncharacterized protein F5147DRAFT_782149 [Suillus discolor]KAG2085237.1 hypothetical protein F5147DRAFT_782149 [Suillus discolor]